MENNYIIIFIICILLMIEQIFSEENQKNNNEYNIKFDKIIFKSPKNINFEVKECTEEISSKIKNPETQIYIPEIKFENVLIDNMVEELNDEKIAGCLKYFVSLDQSNNNENNNNNIILTPAISNEKMVEMPDYCVKEYNELYKSFNEEFLNLLIKNDGKFHMTMNYKEGTFNIDFDIDKVNQEIVDNDKTKNESYDDELEQYYLKSRKDCVEYGLKSSDENLIVCTKYE